MFLTEDNMSFGLRNRSKMIVETLSIKEITGENIPVYVSKITSALTRDRVAVSFLVDIADTYKDYSTTVIKVNDLNISADTEEEQIILNDFEMHKSDIFKSSGVLDYEAAMALLYRLRLDNYVVTDIANIEEGGENNSIAIEELHNTHDFIRITMNESLKGIYEKIIEDATERVDEKHSNRIVTLKIKDKTDKEIEDILTIGFRRTYGVENVYNIYSTEGIKYKILSNEGIAAVISGDTMVITYIKKKVHKRLDVLGKRDKLNDENCRSLGNEIAKVAMQENIRYKLKISGEIISL